MRSPYDWKRYWCPREGHYSLTSDGFLKPPYKRYQVGDVSAFEQITDTPVLLLLGEPGIGKTFAIKAEREAIRAAVAQRGERILWPDLQEVSTPERFDRLVTDTPEFQDWLRGESVLHLYLDALDECMLRVRTLGRLLTNALKNGPPERLWLRLTCRTAEWSNELEADLKRLLGNERVKAFELLPLTKADVAHAVAANDLDEAEFFRYVERTGAPALASRPVPLDFLIRSFQRGDLPKTQVELHERGCLALCEETEHRTETGLQRPFSAVDRLAIAKRIAAYTIFSTRSVLLFGKDDSDVPADALRFDEMTGENERAGAATVEVTEAALRDTLDTGLFTSRGAKVLGWAHHTYEEYLAARYVSDSGLSPEQLLPLLVHPDDAERKLTPQLHGVAAWLAMLRPEIFTYVVEHEPELLLLGNVVIERDEDRARIVDELLKRHRARQLARIDIMAYPKLRKLAHAGIADQLRAVLINRQERDELREFAAHVAEYTACATLVPELTRITLDPTQPANVRVDTAAAVAQIGNETERAALKPLMDGPAATRQERWLIRLAVKAAWPHALSAEKLFAYVAPVQPRFGRIIDDYVLVAHICETLTTEHLSAALRWVLQRVQALPEGPTAKLGDALQRLEDCIIVHAWRSDDDAVTAVLAKVAVEKISRYEPLISRGDLQEEDVSDVALTADVQQRRRFARFLLPAIASQPKRVSAWLLFDKTHYLRRDDLAWLVERQSVVSHTTEEWSLDADVLLYLANISVPSEFDSLWAAAQHNPVLAERVRNICAAVPLGSEKAREEREEYAEMQKRSNERSRQPNPAEPQFDVSARVAEWLTVMDERPCDYWELLRVMAHTPEDPHGNSLNLDVVTFPGWSTAEESTRTKILAHAERFVRECNPNADASFESAMGGVRALTLLKTTAPQTFASLGADVWTKWTPVLLEIPNNDRTVPLLADAYRHVPDEVIRRLQQLVRAKGVYIIHKLSDVMDDRIIAALLAVAGEGRLTDDSLTDLLEPLLHKENARLFAEESIRESLHEGERNRVVALAATLLLHVPNESWETIWPLLTADAAFGRAVIELAANRDRFDAAPVYTLAEDRVARLYLWLNREYPPQQDPEREGIYTPDTRDNISSWRSRCLDSLKRRGTRAACDALRWLAAELPEQTYLPPLVVEAETVRREKSWQPTPVAVLRELLRDRTRRQVRGETELADVIVEALRRLEARLQGETPAAFDLWNTAPYRPKSENEVSNYITRFLREDLDERGVIIAREVEIRPSSSPGSGERTDLHVDVAVDLGNCLRKFSVIVEVKGCWNRGIHGDMMDQLAHRYLRDNTTSTGIFLVAWFAAPAWDGSDSRRAACREDRAALESSLATEAATLRPEGYDIRPMTLNCSLR